MCLARFRSPAAQSWTWTADELRLAKMERQVYDTGVETLLHDDEADGFKEDFVQSMQPKVAQQEAYQEPIRVEQQAAVQPNGSLKIMETIQQNYDSSKILGTANQEQQMATDYYDSSKIMGTSHREQQ